MSKLLSILAVVCLHAVAGGTQPTSPEPVVVILRNLELQPADALAEMQAEVERILAPADRRVEWRTGIIKGEHFAHLLSVSFNGSCVAEPQYRAGLSDAELRKLASAAVSGRSVLPFATVECDAVRKVLTPALSAASRDARDSIMGRALGRVIAHELYHILTRTREHAHAGAGKACFGLADLTAPAFTFDKSNVAQLRPPAAPPALLDAAPAAWSEQYDSGR